MLHPAQEPDRLSRPEQGDENRESGRHPCGGKDPERRSGRPELLEPVQRPESGGAGDTIGGEADDQAGRGDNHHQAALDKEVKVGSHVAHGHCAQDGQCRKRHQGAGGKQSHCYGRRVSRRTHDARQADAELKNALTRCTYSARATWKPWA
jgi:hypothetical protein